MSSPRPRRSTVPCRRSGTRRHTVGDRQVRNAGTIGGSLCWNYVASCMPNVCLCLDATLVLASRAGGERTLPIEEFLVGPLETALRDDELLIEINFPSSKHYGSRQRLQEIWRNGGRINPSSASRPWIEIRRVRALHRRPLQRRRYFANRPTVRRSPRAALRPSGHARDLRRGGQRRSRCNRDADGPPRQCPLSQGADPHVRPRRVGRGPRPRDGEVGA